MPFTSLTLIYRRKVWLRQAPRKTTRPALLPSLPSVSTLWRCTINKLLLVNPTNGTLVVCGSIFRGICSLLNLSNIEQHVYYSDTKGEKTYVVTPDRSVSVVGVISTFTKDKELSVFLVGQGYGSSDSVKLVSTRLLQTNGDMDIFENIVETSTVQAGPYMQRYLHDFRYAFKHKGHVYFLFSRATDIIDNRKLSYVARLCDNDQNYYSYIELQLNCSLGNNNVYNKVQAAYLASPGKILAQNLSSNGNLPEDDRVLFAVFSKTDGLDSALCMYPLSSIDHKLKEALESCSKAEYVRDKPKAVFSPYTTKTEEVCKHKREGIYDTYPCGAEFLPSPLATTAEYALSASPVYTRKSMLTSVAVSVVNSNTVAFVGTNMGEVLKIHLSGHADVYGKFPGDSTDGPANKSMFFDSSIDHLYITTLKKITKVPVQACEQKKDCHSCVSQRDPYCGWCVLEGRCTRKKDCSRGEEKDAWLWSPNLKCVAIQTFDPPSLSCTKTKQVKINVSPLPNLINDELKCVFGDFKSKAEINNQQVVCALPNPVDIPPTAEAQDYVAVPVKLVVNDNIEVTHSQYKFYNCAAVVKNAVNTPCIACVTSQWGCQWNTQDHTCSDQDDSTEVIIIKQNKHDKCPQFQSLEPSLIPVGFKTPISFEGKNLDKYMGKMFQLGTELMNQVGDVITTGSKFTFGGYEFAYDKHPEINVSFYVKDQKTDRRIDSTLQVVLYNCSVGREDCSLCKNADPKYNCVWCDTTQSCIYTKLCLNELEQCPAPTITDITPRFGPRKGQISVTIKGSNLGIKKEDIKWITVAEVPCVHQADRYTVSTSVVCKIGPLPDPPVDLPNSKSPNGPVRVEVEGKQPSVSTVLFTYRDPVPKTVHPMKGPQDGGTVNHLCLEFGSEIKCKTGPYKNQQVPSGPLKVTVKYGESTSVVVSDNTFTYAINPKVTSYSPQASFVCGGRRIMVVGIGFDLVQKAVIRVLPSADEFNLHPSNAEFVQEFISKNKTILEFLSPTVNNTTEDVSFRTVIELDNIHVNLTEFEYHSDPMFTKMVDKPISAGSIIIVHGQGLTKAMTAQEAQAFVGDKQCVVTVLHDDKLFLEAPSTPPKARSRRHRRDTSSETLDLVIKFGSGEFNVGTVRYEKKSEVPLYIIIPAVILPMLLFIAVSVYCYRRKSQQAEREYEKVKHQLESLEESVRDRCKKEFTDLMIEMEDHTSDLSEARIPFWDYRNYTNRVFFLPSKDGANDVMITGKLDIPENRRAIVDQALNQFSNLLNSKTFLINFIRTLESRQDFNARNKGVLCFVVLTVALHGKLEYYTDIMRTLLLELMEDHVHSKNPKLMLRRSETVVERMLCNWMSICLYQFLKDSAGEPLYKLFKAIKHQVEKGPVDAKLKRAKYTLNDTGLLGDDVEYCVLTLQVLVHGEGPDVTPVKVLNCDTISQVKEKIIEQVYRNLPYSQRPTVESVALEWRPGSTGQILSDLDLTSQKEGRWKRLNTLAHYNVRDNATLVLSRVLHTHQSFDQNQESHEEKSALLEEDKVFHLVRPAEELDEVKSKRGSMKDKAPIKTITEIYLTRLLSMKGTLQQFVDDFFRSVLCSGAAVPPAVKYFFDFLDEQAHKHDNVDEETHPHLEDQQVVDASLSVIAQTFMDACTKTEHKLTPESPSNKLLYAKEIPTYKKMVEDYYKGIRQMVPSHTDKLNTQVALHQLYQYASKYYDGIILSLEDDPAAQSKQLTLRLQQIAAALENKVTDL
ncbi:Plexin-B2 [Bagarius yarrelli]|uniref:Plexin-B2 n=1 Tax=Bagarius yarrelli TaxID=175774 RepID=A0A556VUK1_BAGYA|nr:Plexin-B2 [Bagarius yarrelli]